MKTLALKEWRRVQGTILSLHYSWCIYLRWKLYDECGAVVQPPAGLALTHKFSDGIKTTSLLDKMVLTTDRDQKWKCCPPLTRDRDLRISREGCFTSYICLISWCHVVSVASAQHSCLFIYVVVRRDPPCHVPTMLCRSSLSCSRSLSREVRM